jgi:PIN domain nuclease of toxin-antitoxin system
MEEQPPIWRVAANTQNKQLQTDNMGWYSSLGVRDMLTTPLTVKKCHVMKCPQLPWVCTDPLDNLSNGNGK